MANISYQGPVPLPTGAWHSSQPFPAPYPTAVFTVHAPTFSASAGGGFITLGDSELPSGSAGMAYLQTLTAHGGVGPYSFTVTGGSLPAGLLLNASTGVISGTPTGTGTATFTIMATDSAGMSGSQSLSLTIGSGSAPANFGWIG